MSDKIIQFPTTAPPSPRGETVSDLHAIIRRISTREIYPNKAIIMTDDSVKGLEATEWIRQRPNQLELFAMCLTQDGTLQNENVLKGRLPITLPLFNTRLVFHEPDAWIVPDFLLVEADDVDNPAYDYVKEKRVRVISYEQLPDISTLLK